MRTIAAASLLAAVAWAQQAAKPHIPFQCVAEDLDAAGLSCSTAHPCSILVELSSLEVVGSKLFLAGNLHTSDQTVTSLLLSSDDGGRSWSEPYKRVAGAGLEHIQFIDYEYGWIAGQMLQGRPRDAFMLVTRDGGKTWQPKPLFEEARAGAIQQFWFENRNNGNLLIDRMHASETGSRYEAYESMTGGETWTLREVSSKPLTLKRPRGAVTGNPDWRLRADGKAWHVEQRQSDRWREISAFPLQVATCQSAEPTFADPPPDEPEPSKPAEPPAVNRKPPTLKKKK